MENNTSFLNSVLGKISILSVIIAGIGLLINNMYLSHFELVDFNLVQPKSILTGISFCFYFLLYIIVYNFRFDIKNLQAYGRLQILSRGIFKYLILTLFLFFIFDRETGFENDPLFIYLKSSSVITPLLMFFVIWNYLDINEDQKKNFWYIFPYKLVIVLGTIITITTFCLAIWFLEEFREYARSEVKYFILFISIVGAKLRTEIEKEKRKLTKEEAKQKDDKSNYENKSMFSLKGYLDSDWRENIFHIVFITFMCYAWLNDYSRKIHPYMPINIGGAKPYELCINKIDKTIVSGYLIYQNQNTLFLKIENEIHYLLKKDVDFVQMKNESK